MKIVIVGPTHPYKGGIALYTTELAHRLSRAGHDVELISWRAQYPFFYPGKQAGALERPELPLFPRVKLVLSWKNPFGWWRWGRRLRGYDQIIFVWWVPTFQGPAYLTMLRALGRRRPLTAAICHNVLPHEGRPGDKLLARAFLRRMDCLVTHSTAQAELAGQLGGKNIKVAELPLLLSSMPKRPTNRHDLTHELFFFGFVRPYKGVDVLLEALAKVPDVRLTVAGEFWGGHREL